MDLADKIRKIEALMAGTSSEGERKAAELAKQRLQEKTVAEPVEYTVRMDSHWKKRLFMAICQKHGFTTYRYPGQKRTTSMVRVSKSFMEQVLWPEYNMHARAFDELAMDLITDLIAKTHKISESNEIEVKGTLSHLASSMCL